jgi:hypothetical protein
MMRLIQIQNGQERAIALIEEPHARLLTGAASIYHLAQEAIETNTKLTALIQKKATGPRLDYDPIYNGSSPWRLLPAIDHPIDPARCLVSGTGLTHLGSAKNRAAMHEKEMAEVEPLALRGVGPRPAGRSETPNTSKATVEPADLTDSMKMFRWGVEHGKPAPGQIGVAPEWFYKGNGAILRAHNEPLITPSFAEDGGEEGEIAGIYIIAPEGQPHRIGLCVGNEFSDHKFEKKNYLNLAGSKIRTCSLGPELIIDPAFDTVPGTVTIQRGAQTIWTQPIQSGENEMCHSLANIEHHHFKFPSHRRPGDIHAHYFGACALSFGAGIQLQQGDQMIIEFQNFGRPLRNPLHIENVEPALIGVRLLK